MRDCTCRFMSDPELDCPVHGALPDHLQPWYNYPENVKKRRMQAKEIENQLKFYEKKKQARMLAEFLHAAQTYDDQEYIYHIDSVVAILEEFGVADQDAIIAGYLHDTVEDTQATLKLVKKYFGEEVMHTVNAVTNERGINRKERNLKTYQKLMKHKKGIIVKLADRIANVRQSLAKNNMGFFKMYYDEYPSFRSALYDESDLQAKPLWNCLDALMKKGKK